MQLLLNFKAFIGCPLPQALQVKYMGTHISFQEKGRGLWLAVLIMGEATKEGLMQPAPRTNQFLFSSPTRSQGHGGNH